jgi:acyl-CoA synthetase (AMP-forming)/AMP-acid ligase II
MSALLRAPCTEATAAVTPPPATLTHVLLGYLQGPRAESAAGVVLVRERRGQRLSYPAMVRSAMRVANGLREVGLRRGDVVFIALPSREDHAAAFFGVMLAGGLPCCVPGPAAEAGPVSLSNHLLAAVHSLRPWAVIVAHPLQLTLAHDKRLHGHVLALEELMRAPPLDPAAVHPAQPDDVHHLQLTSGSTGRPKAAALSHRAVLANLVLTARAAGADVAQSSGAIWLPLFHDMGLVSLLSAVFHNVDLVLQPPEDFIRHPMGWLQTISCHRATTSAAPTFALAYCVRRYRPDLLHGVDLSHFRHLVVGAERVDVKTLEAFVRTFEPHGFRGDMLLPSYGLAELVLAATVPNGQRRGTLGRNVWCARPRSGGRSGEEAAAVLSMGRPLPTSEVEVRDEQGGVLPAGEQGQIHIRSACLMRGYHGDAQATAAVLRDGWYATGDLGFMQDGELFIVGRMKEVIILRGRNYQPHEFEACVAQHEQVEPGRVAAFGVPDHVLGSERLVLAVEPASYLGLEALRQSLQELLRAEFGFGATEICFVSRGGIPRTTSRKVQRSACAEQYACGALPRTDTRPARAAPAAAAQVPGEAAVPAD